MTTYILYDNGVLEKDGFSIQIGEDSPDYLDYLAWVAAGNQPTSQTGSVYLAKLADDKAARQQLRDQYQAALDRLNQIATAGTIPFTQAGYNNLVAAVEDEARYLRIVAKILAKLYY